MLLRPTLICDHNRFIDIMVFKHLPCGRGPHLLLFEIVGKFQPKFNSIRYAKIIFLQSHHIAS